MDSNFKILQYVYDPNLNIEFKEGQIVKGIEVEKKNRDDFDYVNVFVPSKNTTLPLIKGVHLVPTTEREVVMTTTGLESTSKDIVPNKGDIMQTETLPTGGVKPAKTNIKPKDFAKKSVKENTSSYLLAMVAGGLAGYASRKAVFKTGKMSIFIVSGAVLGAFAYGVYSYNKEK